jgi:hypothetical protein
MKKARSIVEGNEADLVGHSAICLAPQTAHSSQVEGTMDPLSAPKSERGGREVLHRGGGGCRRGVAGPSVSIAKLSW